MLSQSGVWAGHRFSDGQLKFSWHSKENPPDRTSLGRTKVQQRNFTLPPPFVGRTTLLQQQHNRLVRLDCAIGGFTETATSRIARNGPYQLQPRKVAAEAGHCSRQRIARLSNPDVAESAYPTIVWTLIDPHRAFTYNLRTGLVWFARHRSLGETPPAPLPAESQVQSLGDVTGVCVVGLVW